MNHQGFYIKTLSLYCIVLYCIVWDIGAFDLNTAKWLSLCAFFIMPKCVVYVGARSTETSHPTNFRFTMGLTADSIDSRVKPRKMSVGP